MGSGPELSEALAFSNVELHDLAVMDDKLDRSEPHRANRIRQRRDHAIGQAILAVESEYGAGGLGAVHA